MSSPRGPVNTPKQADHCLALVSRGLHRDRKTGRKPNRKEEYLDGTVDSLFTSVRLGVQSAEAQDTEPGLRGTFGVASEPQYLICA